MGDVVAQPESLPFRHGSLRGSEGLNEGTGEGSQPEVLMQVAPVGSNCSVGATLTTFVISGHTQAGH